MIRKILSLRIWSLFLKEFQQIRRNRRLVVLLIIPPTLNIILFGFALNPDFENLRLGVVDYSATPESRDLVLAFTESLAFKLNGFYASPDELGRAIEKARLDAGLVIPRDFAKRRARGETVEVRARDGGEHQGVGLFGHDRAQVGGKVVRDGHGGSSPESR